MSSTSPKKFFYKGISIPRMCKMYRSSYWILIWRGITLSNRHTNLVLYRCVLGDVVGLAFSICQRKGVDKFEKADYRNSWRIWNNRNTDSLYKDFGKVPLVILCLGVIKSFALLQFRKAKLDTSLISEAAPILVRLFAYATKCAHFHEAKRGNERR